MIDHDSKLFKMIEHDAKLFQMTEHDSKLPIMIQNDMLGKYTNEVRVQICKKAKKYLELIQIRFVLSQTRRKGILSGADKGTL